jgi:hypothetical protein
MYLLKHPKKCPHCGEKAGARIMWGSPSMYEELDEKLQAAIDRGTLVLGGCVYDNEADFRCKACGHEWFNPEKMVMGNMRFVGLVIDEIENGTVRPDILDLPMDVYCDRYYGLCDKTWESLITTDRDGVRYCNDCERKVYLVKTRDDLDMMHPGQCVAYYNRHRKYKNISNKG